jgi:hypothetical protein
MMYVLAGTGIGIVIAIIGILWLRKELSDDVTLPQFLALGTILVGILTTFTSLVNRDLEYVGGDVIHAKDFPFRGEQYHKIVFQDNSYLVLTKEGELMSQKGIGDDIKLELDVEDPTQPIYIYLSNKRFTWFDIEMDKRLLEVSNTANLDWESMEFERELQRSIEEEIKIEETIETTTTKQDTCLKL